ncbi:hypothetical protein [Mycolicibacterium sp.]|uniref:hypothetical protein n=1 Tax=Mycolicibacterium sp. TaxID=2320850 RepID=UPI001A1B0B8B|nr:hypothetical protein [Mycolicibacterium sp.]MBJ7339319.1 hypothetical protein [Mycolicibacterium sp.]
MTTIARRIAATAALLAAPALIALGTAGASQADTSITNNGPSVSSPVHRDAFPHQSNTPQPGTSVHHHHQGHR